MDISRKSFLARLTGIAAALGLGSAAAAAKKPPFMHQAGNYREFRASLYFPAAMDAQRIMNYEVSAAMDTYSFPEALFYHKQDLEFAQYAGSKWDEGTLRMRKDRPIYKINSIAKP